MADLLMLRKEVMVRPSAMPFEHTRKGPVVSCMKAAMDISEPSTSREICFLASARRLGNFALRLLHVSGGHQQLHREVCSELGRGSKYGIGGVGGGRRRLGNIPGHLGQCHDGVKSASNGGI